MALTANESTLYLNGWRNGSLFDQRSLFINLSSNASVYQGNNYDQGLSLSLFDNDLASLTFNASDNTTALAFALTEALFDPNTFKIGIRCVYPLSGQYDTLSRILFYVLMVFSLVFRRHVWISVAALGTAMTYSATAAIHLLALVTNFQWGSEGGGLSRFNETGWNSETSKPFGDVDFFGIFPILTASGIMLTPILMWSTTVREYRAQSIIIYWGILIFAGLICSLYTVLRGASFDIIPSFASCTKSEECLNKLEPFFFTYNGYKSCNCIDFCALLSPDAPMRESANMVPYLGHRFAENILRDGSFVTFWAISFLSMAFIVISGIIGILGSRWSQEEVRNAIFRVLNADARDWIVVLFEGERETALLKKFHWENPDTKMTLWKRFRYFYAKCTATWFFLTAMLTTILCPPFFVSMIIANEFVVQYIPVSEHSDAVGAWATWVGAALVLIATVIDRYCEAWLDTTLIILTSIWNFFKYSKVDRPRHSENKEFTVRRRVELFFFEIAGPFIHAWYSTRGAFWTVRITMKRFAEWWHDTPGMSQKSGNDIEKAWAKERAESHPVCKCSMCKRERMKETEEKEKENEKEKKKEETMARLVVGRFRNRLLKQKLSGQKDGEEEGEELVKTSSSQIPLKALSVKGGVEGGKDHNPASEEGHTGEQEVVVDIRNLEPLRAGHHTLVEVVSIASVTKDLPNKQEAAEEIVEMSGKRDHESSPPN
ncbi:hypothetical protein G7Y89_g8776 [Cudoniella acicularis]|uniref:Uncharacterized protein n=1 Tax=Cudoniella acicularis TaxID=354080 RepID=A0A8H4RHJ5_9HELO|nr:hypothetical protein G7Y89_g8776 [Cudoniella acicularis]